MKCSFDIPADLYKDELVCFIADRYRLTTRQIWECFFRQEREVGSDCGEEPRRSRLEDNEMEILRGLLKNGHSSHK